jgi:hypothetical protein
MFPPIAGPAAAVPVAVPVATPVSVGTTWQDLGKAIPYLLFCLPCKGQAAHSNDLNLNFLMKALTFYF